MSKGRVRDRVPTVPKSTFEILQRDRERERDHVSLHWLSKVAKVATLTLTRRSDLVPFFFPRYTLAGSGSWRRRGCKGRVPTLIRLFSDSLMDCSDDHYLSPDMSETLVIYSLAAVRAVYTVRCI